MKSKSFGFKNSACKIVKQAFMCASCIPAPFAWLHKGFDREDNMNSLHSWGAFVFTPIPVFLPVFHIEDLMVLLPDIHSDVHAVRAEEWKDDQISWMWCGWSWMVSVFVTSRCLLSASPALVLSPVCSGPLPPSPLSPFSSPALSPPAGFYHPGAPCTFRAKTHHLPKH